MVIVFPVGGPYVLPILLSTLASTFVREVVIHILYINILIIESFTNVTEEDTREIIDQFD